MPVGFKWFVEGVHQRELVFAGDTWITDKDVIALCLLAAEITEVTGLTPSQYYAKLTAQHGTPFYRSIDAAATPEQKSVFKGLTAAHIVDTELAGEAINTVLLNARGNGAAIGGIKVCTQTNWFAARPSGAEALYKIYVESFVSEAHLQLLID